jgi:hypothetical protein
MYLAGGASKAQFRRIPSLRVVARANRPDVMVVAWGAGSSLGAILVGSSVHSNKKFVFGLVAWGGQKIRDR